MKNYLGKKESLWKKRPGKSIFSFVSGVRVEIVTFVGAVLGPNKTQESKTTKKR